MTEQVRRVGPSLQPPRPRRPRTESRREQRLSRGSGRWLPPWAPPRPHPALSASPTDLGRGRFLELFVQAEEAVPGSCPHLGGGQPEVSCGAVVVTDSSQQQEAAQAQEDRAIRRLS